MSVAFRSWLSVVRDATRTQLWPFPTLAVVLAVAAGVVLPLVDAAIDGTFPASGVLFAVAPTPRARCCRRCPVR